jgi:hypothetical protein
LLLTAAGEEYLPSISRAFHAISDATDKVASALKGRRLRFAISPTLHREEHPAIAHLKRHQSLEAPSRRSLAARQLPAQARDHATALRVLAVPRAEVHLGECHQLFMLRALAARGRDAGTSALGHNALHLGNQLLLGREIRIERAMRQAGTPHDVSDADAADTMLAERSCRRLDEARLT